MNNKTDNSLVLLNFIWNRLLSVLSLSVFRVCLDLSYIYFINPFYSYAGYDFNFNLKTYILSWFIYLVFCVLISPDLNKPSDFFFITAATGLMAPLTSLYGLSERDIVPVVVTSSSLILILFMVNVKQVLPFVRVSFKNGKEKLNYLSWFMLFFLIFWYFATGAVKYFNLDFKKVYEFRSLSAEVANVGVMAYINSWTYKIFSIYAISFALLKRKFYLIPILLAIQTFYFGVNAHKSVFFTPFLVIGVWFYLQKFKTLLVMPLVLTFLLSFSFILFLVTDDLMLPSMFIRRLFFVPAELTFQYFEFFNNNPHIYWSNSFLKYFLEYPYSLDLPKLIGAYMGTGAAANNGFISSGFAHFGNTGVAIYSVIFAFILRVLNYCVKLGLPKWLVVILTIIPIRSALISSDLNTTLLTHGLFISLVLLLLSIEKHEPNKEIT